MLTTRYTLSGISELDYETTVEHLRQELRNHGFNPLCEIDVQQTMRDRLGVEMEPYLILGACNPGLARRALDVDPEIGVFLPWNIVVYEHHGVVRVAAVDPGQIGSLVDDEELESITAEVGRWLGTVVGKVTED